jgi:hypothetical protein
VLQRRISLLKKGMNFQRILPTATGKHKGKNINGNNKLTFLNIYRKFAIFRSSHGRIVFINGDAQFARPFRGIFKYCKL